MASTDLVTAARRDIFVGDIEENRPNSENVNRKLAGNINFLLERMVIQEKFVYGGFFNSATVYDTGAAGIVRIENISDITHYYLSLRAAGSGGTSAFNIAVFDNVGASKGNLFSSAISISGNGGSNIVIGKQGVDTLTPTLFQVNTAGHTINHGTLSITQFTAGDILVPFIQSNANQAYNLSFAMKLREI